MAEEKKTAMPHNLVLEDRRLLTVSGVSDVDSFDEETVVLRTGLGTLIIQGSGLQTIMGRWKTDIGTLVRYSF